MFRTLSTCGWLQEWRNEHIQSPSLAISGDICKINGLFTLLPHLSPLCSIKEPGIQTPIRWLFWGISLPPSQSADFLNKVVFLASISYVLDLSGCCAVSRVTLDSVTAGGEVWNRLVLRRRQPCPHLELQSFERNHACCLSAQSEVTQPQDTHTPSRAAHRGRAEWTGGQSGQVSRFDTHWQGHLCHLL